MSTIFDVRNDVSAIIDEIRFSDNSIGIHTVAHKVTQFSGSARDTGVKIHDAGSFVLVKSKEHADNLRKALDKAEELGWLK